MKRNTIYKCRISYDDFGRAKITSFENREIPGGLFNQLNTKVHEAVRAYNGDSDWIKQYIRFEKDEIKYKQIDTTDKVLPCSGCCFNTRFGCGHPHFDTKPYCTDRIYVVEQYDELDRDE